MIRIENVDIGGFAGINIDVPAGATAKIITDSDFGKAVLLDLLAGIRRPDRGNVALMGNDIYSLSGADAIGVYKNVGVVWHGGGIISNLKVWENILLPAMYHTGYAPENAEDAVRDVLRRFNIEGDGLERFLHSLPGKLPMHERLLVGFVRVMFMNPDIMIFDSIFEGINPESADALARTAVEMRRGKPSMTMALVSSDEHSLLRIKADMVFRQKGALFEAGKDMP